MTDDESRDLPRIPELEEDYELIRELGRGGTAVVYLARERDVERYVAIKLMHPGYVQDEEAVARLMREARTVARLQHPNIVMLLGVRRLGDRGYALILQYVPGTTVKERIRQEGPLPIPLAERILIDLGSALQYAHRHRIVHRDIKPENIFLDADTGVSRLADFGIARFWDSDSGLTLPGTAIGTPTYMSPEQVDGRDLDGRSDLYSVGLVAWEMLTGQAPWAGETMYKIVYKQKHEELPSLEELRPEVPHYIRAAIEKALKKNPNDRWRDAGEFLAALQNPYAHLARPTPGRKPSAPGPSPLAPASTESLPDAPTILFNREEMARAMAREGAETGRAGAPESAPTEGEAGAEGAAGSGSMDSGMPRPAGPPPSPPPPTPPPGSAPRPPSWLRAVEEGAVDRTGPGPSLRSGGADRGGSGAPSWRPPGGDAGATGRPGDAGTWRGWKGLLAGTVVLLLALAGAGVLYVRAGGSGESAEAVAAPSVSDPGVVQEGGAGGHGGVVPEEDAEPGSGEGAPEAPAPSSPPPAEEATSAPAIPAAVADLAEGSREGVAGAPLAERVVVRVVDGQGNGVGAVDVVWEVLSGGGSLERVAGRTGPGGTASNAWTLGPEPGPQALRVRVPARDGVAGVVTARALPPPV